MVCLPAIAAAAYFVAIILLDLYNREWKQIPGRALVGVFVVLLVLFICQRASEFVAWILLLAPFGLVLLSYLLSKLWAGSSSEPAEAPCADSCPCCAYRPCRCRRPCWRPAPVCPQPKPKPVCPEPKPKPDNCIKASLADE